jgi:hypothetical protein
MLSGEMHFRQSFCSHNRNLRVLIASGAATVFRGSPYPCASASIRAFRIHVIPLRTWRPLREEEGQRTFSRLFPVAVRKDFYNFLPFFSVLWNCLRAKCKGQFFTVVKIINAMSYANTGLGSSQKNSRLMGGQIPPKTARQNIKNKGIFASIRPVRPICPFAFGKLPWDSSRSS